MSLPGASSLDVAVVGLGAVGSATLYHLARSGARVVGVDRFHPPHDRGSSHGLTRITRLAVGEGDAFVPLVARSHQLWRELEAATGQTLYTRTGGLLVVAEGANDWTFHGSPGFYSRTVEIARAHGIVHEILTAAEVRERFPMFTPNDGDQAYFERDAGVLYPERAVAAQLERAVAHGAMLRLDERVRGVTPSGGGVAIETERGTLYADRAVVTAGAWMPQLVGAAAIGRELRVLRQVLYWFRAADPALYAPGRCPVWIWVHGRGAAGAAYGFPMGDGIDGAKTATEQDTSETDPDAVERSVSEAEVQAMYETHLRGRVRGLLPQAVRSATCLYTNTADAAFVVRDHPQSAAITLVSACSGHGFKHSAALGEALAARAAGREPLASLLAFAPHAAL